MIETFVHIKNGEITNKQAVKKAFLLPNGKYAVTIKRAGKRSIQQNRYYFGVVVEMIQEKVNSYGDNFSKEDIHDWLKEKFNYKEVVFKNTGELEKIPQSTTKLNTVEFEEYLEKVKHYAATSLDLIIPDPGSQSSIWDVSYQANYDKNNDSLIIEK